jgi:AraC-like DNA-binding protein
MPFERHSHLPAAPLRPFLLAPLEAWTQTDGERATLREVPIPGVPLIFGIGSSWTVDAEPLESFVAGLHARPALVQPDEASWSCIELRVTPVAAHRIFGWPMHELANRSVALVDLVPGAQELTERLRDAREWSERFELVESFLSRRLADSPVPAREVEWSWHELRRTAGRAQIGELANDIGWSHRRLIARFREQVGLSPKAVARVIRFDYAAQALRSSTRGLAEIAYDSGYFDQAHLNRDFRELAGTTPTTFRSSTLESGGIAA